MAALYIIPILAVLILIHEFGHFITARMAGIRVHEFGIGLPPRLAGFTRNGILYSFNALPIGGFVRVLGEDGKSFEPDSLQAKSRARRALFFGAGSLMNLLLAIVLITVLVGARGDTITHVYVAGVEDGSPAAQAGWQVGDQFLKVDGKEITSVDQMVGSTDDFVGKPMSVTLQRGGQTVQTTVVPRLDPPPGQGRTGIEVVSAAASRIAVDTVTAGSPAAQAGILPGDTLLTVDGHAITDGQALLLTLQAHQGESIPLRLERDGQAREVQVQVPQASSSDAQPTIGIGLSQHVITQPVAWWKVVPRGVAETFNSLHLMVTGVVSLVQGQATLSGVAGPIGMGQLTSEMLKLSPEPAWVTLFNISALLSLNLALLNLIPFPALDGGRLFFLLIELIRGKRVPPEKEGMVHFVGLVVLLTFMLVVAYHDIDRIVSGTPFIR
ncbi:MAG TPA: RIP metalloprotease RseP [Thermomicrobiaceae bacterium]|nr:RIP metalloprotease RseP [Thermomicrobiaceae bacterium]